MYGRYVSVCWMHVRVHVYCVRVHVLRVCMLRVCVLRACAYACACALRLVLCCRLLSGTFIEFKNNAPSLLSLRCNLIDLNSSLSSLVNLVLVVLVLFLLSYHHLAG